MLDLRLIREHPERIRDSLQQRNVSLDLDRLLALDRQVLDCIRDLEAVRRRRNEIGQQMKGKLAPEARQTLVEEGRSLKEQESVLDQAHQAADTERQELLKQVPNLSHPDSPVGGEEASRELRAVGQKPAFDFEPKDHVQLMEALDLVDFEGGAKVAGQKFYYLKNEAVLIELALVQFATQRLREHGFTLFITPDLARQDILQGIGFNPRGDSTQIYSIADSDLSLIATAEITLGGLLAGEILDESRLPLLYAGISHCFRTEAGSAGRESRGLYRVHQFTKVEMFAFVHPDQSEVMHQKLLDIEEGIYQSLEVPYRVLDIATGDLGAPAYRKYDLEAWMPGRGQWGEITSTSNCTDYQARRLDIRFKSAGQKGTRFVHMLNGTAIAVPRAMIALMENGQRRDGSIHLPACLGLADIGPR